ncbi:MAG: polysaccharide deacetylase family protein [Desulfitobacteriaceae bacterium]|nr:polysaccharide deacetylase family protein [Desulfitobacteriaceae bacterium]MDD4751781.1 polysaccharide deacetylase family protein [Desulfitobacteriaceae bacterium]
MKVIFLSKKSFTNWAIGLLCLLTAVYLAGNWWQQTTTVSVVKNSPIYQGCSEKKQVSLAINVDWGEEYLPDMLNILESNHVNATFFITGRWAQKFPEITQSINQKGHEIGNHGFSHASPNKMSLEQNKSEIARTMTVIEQATGKKTRLFAPPSGERADHVLQAAAELGYSTILWSVDTIDWERPSPDVIINRVMKKVHNGAIILMHPTKSTLEALPKIIQELKNREYILVTVSENVFADMVKKDS